MSILTVDGARLVLDVDRCRQGELLPGRIVDLNWVMFIDALTVRGNVVLADDAGLLQRLLSFLVFWVLDVPDDI